MATQSPAVFCWHSPTSSESQDAGTNRKASLLELRLSSPLCSAFSGMRLKTSAETQPRDFLGSWDVAGTVPKQTFRKVHYVKDYTPKQAFEDSLVSDLYKTPEEAELRIRQFANLLAPKGMFRETIKHNKCNMFKAMLPSLKDELFDFKLAKV